MKLKIMKQIAVFLADGFEEIEAITIIDVLRRADFKVTTISISNNTEVTGSHQIKLIADRLFDQTDFGIFDMIILPGGMPGAKNLDEHKGLKIQIAKFNELQKPIGAICAAPFVLGNLGILKNKNVVCYPGYENYLVGANVKNDSVAVSDNIITGRGVGAALDFSLKIVGILDSPQKAEKLAKAMLVK